MARSIEPDTDIQNADWPKRTPDRVEDIEAAITAGEDDDGGPRRSSEPDSNAAGAGDHKSRRGSFGVRIVQPIDSVRVIKEAPVAEDEPKDE